MSRNVPPQRDVDELLEEAVDEWQCELRSLGSGRRREKRALNLACRVVERILRPNKGAKKRLNWPTLDLRDATSIVADIRSFADICADIREGATVDALLFLFVPTLARRLGH